MLPASQVRLICEVVSRGNAANDQLLKMQTYTAAGIPWYLIAEQPAPRSVMLRLHRLNGEHYREHTVAEAGDIMCFTDPFTLDLDPATLLDQ